MGARRESSVEKSIYAHHTGSVKGRDDNADEKNHRQRDAEFITEPLQAAILSETYKGRSGDKADGP